MAERGGWERQTKRQTDRDIRDRGRGQREGVKTDRQTYRDRRDREGWQREEGGETDRQTDRQTETEEIGEESKERG